MKAKEIEIGGRYVAKVSGKLAVVKVLRAVNRHPRINWVCRNEATGREITVKSAQRFRYAAEEKTGREFFEERREVRERAAAVDILVRRGDPTQEAPGEDHVRSISGRTFGDLTDAELAEIIRDEASEPGSTGGAAVTARAVLQGRGLSGPAWHDDPEINALFEQRRKAAEDADSDGAAAAGGWSRLEHLGNQLNRLDPEGDWYYEGNRHDGLGWQVHRPAERPSCVICGETIPEGQRAIMYDRARLGQPDYRSGDVHAECGIAEGWEVS